MSIPGGVPRMCYKWEFVPVAEKVVPENLEVGGFQCFENASKCCLPAQHVHFESGSPFRVWESCMKFAVDSHTEQRVWPTHRWREKRG